MNNPSNQPEPNYAQYICKGAHCKCMNNDGTCKAFHNGDHTCPSSQPDAQAKVGLRDKVDDFMCCRQLFINIDRDIHREILDDLMALFQADKVAAVCNAQLQIRLHVLSILKAEADQTFGNVKQFIYTEHQKAWDELKAYQEARLQSPTAGEGESV